MSELLLRRCVREFVAAWPPYKITLWQVETEPRFGLVLEASDNQRCRSESVDALFEPTLGIVFEQEVFQNAQRTSSRNRILNAEAVYQFASVLHEHGISTMQDVARITWYEDAVDEIRKPYAQKLLSIPGQRSGLSLSYFYMLTGSTGLV